MSIFSSVLVEITPTEFYFLLSAFIIALFGLSTKYRYISIILLIEFLVMTAYQTFVLDSRLDLFSTIQLDAWFYSIKFVLQAFFLLAYYEYKSRALSLMSVIIMVYLFYAVVYSLMGIDLAEYTHVMTVLSSIQLLIGLIGVINGHRNNINFIRSRSNMGR